MGLTSQRLSTHIGAEVEGVDLGAPLRDEEVQALRALLVEHHVLFFRNQAIGPEQMIAVAERFGAIDTHAFGRHLPGFPTVGLLDQSQPERDGANRWHTDSTFMPKPPFGALLRAVQVPDVGGDTSWCSAIAAYDALSVALRRTLAKLSATHDISRPLLRAAAGGHSLGSVDEVMAKWPPVTHPLVCRHPETGRSFLYCNSNFTTRIEDVTEAESDALLRFLFQLVRAPEFQVRFRWEVGSVALWDNRCTQHYAAADYQERRIMHRVTIAGDWAPSAA